MTVRERQNSDSLDKMIVEQVCGYCDCEPIDVDEDDIDKAMNMIVSNILKDYEKDRDIDNMKAYQQPDKKVVIDIVKKMLTVLFPGYYHDDVYRTRNMQTQVHVILEDVMYSLRKQVERVLLYDERYEDASKLVRKRVAQKICKEFFETIPKIRDYLNTDIQATFDGDPAANNKDEIILSYPGLLATAVYRMAHELFKLDVLMIPRMMTEYAHSITGVDIHPGATIGKYFFIDHATGIVIGSTSEIGEHVKIYQGVTIGALSTRKGQLLHGVKRHPTIEDYVTIYSGASILGGNTVLGEGSIIGGNSFITESVKPNSRVSIKTEVVID